MTILAALGLLVFSEWEARRVSVSKTLLVAAMVAVGALGLITSARAGENGPVTITGYVASNTLIDGRFAGVPAGTPRYAVFCAQPPPALTFGNGFFMSTNGKGFSGCWRSGLRSFEAPPGTRLMLGNSTIDLLKSMSTA